MCPLIEVSVLINVAGVFVLMCGKILCCKRQHLNHICTHRGCQSNMIALWGKVKESFSLAVLINYWVFAQTFHCCGILRTIQAAVINCVIFAY